MKTRNNYSYEFKLGCVKQMEDQYRSSKSLGKELGITYSLLDIWYKIYKHSGPSGLLPRKGKRVFSSVFKLQVLTAIREENLSLKEARVRFDLSSDSHILNWQKSFVRFGAAGLEPRPKGRPLMEKNDKLPNKRKKKVSKVALTKEEQLLQELEYLKAENALLKKLQALVQKDNKRKP